MPIRMDKDDIGGNKDNYPGGGKKTQNTTGGGGGMAALLPFLITLISKRPKLLLVLLLVAGLWYFFGGGLSNMTNAEASSDFGTGMEMKQELYDKAEVFEPLADNKANPLPERVSLLEYAPNRLNQGQQGSCVGWASSYAARTILHARQTGVNPNRVVFSPAYVYNQIAINKNCQGAYMIEAMKTLHQDGDVPFAAFPYDESSCNARPDQSTRQVAADYRIKGYNRLSMDHDKYAVNMLAMKQNLAQGAPVVIGMQVGGSFMQSMKGRDKWIPTSGDYSMRGFGGHAMCVIGYDDYKFGNEGGFQIMNSWGEDWGDEGVAWVKYKDFEFFTKEAYGLYPMGDANKVTTTALAINFGLVKVDAKGGVTGKINVKADGPNSFSSTQPINIGERFKVEITNSVECYVYIFGQETDGSSYVLFPYTKKHSPYCGITGTRLFPRDLSMKADDLGNRDYIAAVFTKVPLDYDRMNTAIQNASGNNYAEKLDNALGQAGVNGISFTTGESIGFKVQNMSEQQAVGVVIGFDKR